MGFSKVLRFGETSQRPGLEMRKEKRRFQEGHVVDSDHQGPFIRDI